MTVCHVISSPFMRLKADRSDRCHKRNKKRTGRAAALCIHIQAPLPDRFFFIESLYTKVSVPSTSKNDQFEQENAIKYVENTQFFWKLLNCFHVIVRRNYWEVGRVEASS